MGTVLLSRAEVAGRYVVEMLDRTWSKGLTITYIEGFLPRAGLYAADNNYVTYMSHASHTHPLLPAPFTSH